MQRAKTSILLYTVAVALLCAAPVGAQSEGKISGAVRDSSGGVMPGVTITVVNQQTNAQKAVTTTGDGTYAVASLAAGTYTVTAELLGFRKAIQKDQQLSAGGSATVDFTLVAKLAEEITVTAMRREETVHDVPFSIAAPTEDVLRDRGATDIEDVAANVAGFDIQNTGPGQSTVAMRGVSSGQIVRDQPGVKEQVGAYLDESVVSMSLFTPDLDLFDVNRIEVLRGPQGTLFGSGSESGTVRYITNQPELGATRWFGEVGGNTIKSGNQGGDAKLGFNAPLGDTAAIRVAGYYNRMGGFIDAVQPDLSVKTSVNTGDRSGVRAAVKWVPDSHFTITPRFVFQSVNSDGWNRVDIFNILANPFTTTRPAVTLGPYQEFSQLPENYTDRFYLGDLNLTYNFGQASLSSITSFTHRDILVIRDATTLTSSITGGSIGLPENVYTLNSPLHDKTTAETWTEELRLSGATAGKNALHWVIGGFYAHNKRDYGQSLPTTGFTALTGIPTASVFAPTDDLFHSILGYKLNQYAAFGELTVAVTDQFSLTGGLRYYHFSEDKAQVFDGLFGEGADGLPQSQPGSVSADGVAPRFIASYKVSDQTSLNAQASKGFRLGGYNDPLNVSLCTPQDLITFGHTPTWADETTWNYEVGSKSTLFAGKGSLNVGVFYMDVRDLQATVTAGSCSSRVIFNVPKARSQGGEVEFEVAPSRHFNMAISGSYDDAVYKSSVTSVAPDGSVSIVAGIQDGVRLPAVPKYQIAGAATYQFTVMQNALAYITGSFHTIGSRFTKAGDNTLGTLDLLSFGANTIGGPLTQSTFNYNPLLPAYTIVNGRVGVRRDKWDLAAYVDNLTNERALLALDYERGTRARIFYLVNQPLTVGINLHFNF